MHAYRERDARSEVRVTDESAGAERCGMSLMSRVERSALVEKKRACVGYSRRCEICRLKSFNCREARRDEERSRLELFYEGGLYKL